MDNQDHGPVEAVIFDLDGTLIDSEPMYKLADEQFFRLHGIDVPEAEFEEFVGLSSHRVIDYVKEKYGLEGATDQLVAEKTDIYLAMATGGTTVFAPMRDLILELLLRGIPLAVATSSSRHVLESVLADSGLKPVFPVSVTSDDVRELKPAPEMFLKAAHRLGVPPGHCWVIEDSQYGVQAALSAGMGVVAVPAAGHENMATFAGSDLVFTGGAAKLIPGSVLDAMGLTGPTAAESEGRRSARPTVEGFRNLVYGHYARHRREMPWRGTTNPYLILVSELMLQQTQTERVIPRYRDFVAAFPTVADLASATLKEVMALWQGLGYNRRAKYLHEAAKAIVDRHGGEVPSTLDTLKSLPGVGEYTAGAVMAFACNAPVVFLETNIRRVFLQVFHQEADLVPDRRLLPLIGVTLDAANPREWYYALMDYGSYLGSAFTNANRRSAHYRRQSPFAGSVREVRGRIVRVLTAGGATGRAELERQVAPGDERFEAALEGLLRDGLVVIDGEMIALR